MTLIPTVESAEFIEQRAPWSEILAEVVRTFRYKPGWRFRMLSVDRDSRGFHPAVDIHGVDPEHCAGLTLMIWPATTNSYDPSICPDSPASKPHIVADYHVVHLMPVPAATYNRVSWENWMMDQILLVEAHEAFEFARFDGQRLFAPIHAPGFDPYMRTVVVTDENRRTSFRGDLKPA
jgi:hypothetical protein